MSVRHRNIPGVSNILVMTVFWMMFTCVRETWIFKLLFTWTTVSWLGSRGWWQSTLQLWCQQLTFYISPNTGTGTFLSFSKHMDENGRSPPTHKQAPGVLHHFPSRLLTRLEKAQLQKSEWIHGCLSSVVASCDKTRDWGKYMVLQVWPQ